METNNTMYINADMFNDRRVYVNGVECTCDKKTLSDVAYGNFAQALESLKCGHVISRKSWDKQYLYLYINNDLGMEGVSTALKNTLSKDITEEVLSNIFLCLSTRKGVKHNYQLTIGDLVANDWFLVGDKLKI